ncbi:MAG: gliding motility-associated C-terminal domain-containing protein [Saprospirales bacterium]|nr:gliding motility-associated C-terminal domain-containing protein [Saprospirales bacterium]
MFLCTAAYLPVSARNAAFFLYYRPNDTIFFSYVVPLCSGDAFQGIPIFRDTVLSSFHTGTAGTDTVLTWLVDSTPLPDFDIAGDTLLCAGQTGRIEVAGNYAAYNWSTGASSKSIDINTGGWYTVRATSSLGCTGVDSVQVKIIQMQLELETGDPTCYGLTDGFAEVLSAGSQSPAPHVYQLNTSGIQTSSLFENLGAGQFQMKAIDAAGCSDSLFFQLSDPAPFAIDIGPDRLLSLGDVAQLTVSGTTPIVRYQWRPTALLDCDTCAMPLVLRPVTTAVFLEAEDANGCTATDTLQLFFDNAIALYVPNAFSPNGDGRHDQLAVSAGSSVIQLEYFRIFDRWGSLVFERRSVPGAPVIILWDGTSGGKTVPSGAYIWVASVRLEDQQSAVRKGTISLIF